MTQIPATPRACPVCVPTPIVPRPRNALMKCWICGAYHTNESRLCDISPVQLAEFAAHFVPSPLPVTA